MADSNSINSAVKAEIAMLSSDLSMLCSQLAGVKPILRSITDSSTINGEDGNAIEAVGALCGYILTRMDEIQGALSKLGETEEDRAAVEAIRQQVAEANA